MNIKRSDNYPKYKNSNGIRARTVDHSEGWGFSSDEDVQDSIPLYPDSSSDSSSDEEETPEEVNIGDIYDKCVEELNKIDDFEDFVYYIRDWSYKFFDNGDDGFNTDFENNEIDIDDGWNLFFESNAEISKTRSMKKLKKRENRIYDSDHFFV